MNFKEWFLGTFKDVKVYKNPSHNELLNVISKSVYKQLKGIVEYDIGDVYIWDGAHTLHDDIASELPLQEPYYGKFYIFLKDDGPYIMGYNDISSIKQQPKIQKMMGSVLEPV